LIDVALIERHVVRQHRGAELGRGLHAHEGQAVLDDRAARRLAASQGVPLLGSLRVIVKAKERGLIPLARPALEKLRGSGAYVSDELIERAIALAGET
jgi:predicted nucleic acid-binding protein